MGILDIAQICHEANRAYCVTQGDFTQLPWKEAPEWQRTSAVHGVQHVVDNPDALPEDSHNSWLAEKTAEGWKYGPVKNAETKEHPCFVPYAELPPAQAAKDVLFLAVARALIPLVQL
jgi:hypothetical protein